MNLSSNTTQLAKGLKLSSFLQSEQFYSFIVYYLLNILILFLLNLYTARLTYKNRAAKKIAYLLVFIVHYSFGRFVFRSIHTLISTALPLLTIYIMDWVFGDLLIVGVVSCNNSSSDKSVIVTGLLKNYRFFKKIDGDDIVRRSILPGGKSHELVKRFLGNRVKQYIEPGSKMIKRQKLDELMRNDQNLRLQIQSGLSWILFVEVLKNTLAKILLSRNKQIFIEIPRDYQSTGLQYLCYPIFVLDGHKDQQAVRLSKKDIQNRDQENTLHKNHQNTNGHSVILIRSSGSPDQTVQQVMKVLNKYVKP